MPAITLKRLAAIQGLNTNRACGYANNKEGSTTRDDQASNKFGPPWGNFREASTVFQLGLGEQHSGHEGAVEEVL